MNVFEKLKDLLFQDGKDAVEQFTQCFVDSEDKNVMFAAMDEAVENMPLERLHWYFCKYGLPYDKERALGHCGWLPCESDLLKQGDRVWLSGDSAEFWIEDYNVRVTSGATVVETPKPTDKKVLVTIDTIDGDSNVTVFVRRTLLERIREEKPDLDSVIKSCEEVNNSAKRDKTAERSADHQL